MTAPRFQSAFVLIVLWLAIYPAALAAQWLVDELAGSQQLRWWLQFGSHRLLFEQVLADTLIASLWASLWLFNFLAAAWAATKMRSRMVARWLAYPAPLAALILASVLNFPVLVIWMALWSLVATVMAQRLVKL